MQRLTFTLIIAGLMSALAFTFSLPPAAHAQSGDQYYLMQLVNDFRAQYGLPPYKANPQLMAAAQAHSEWAASVGQHSHTGPGGSTPRDRAIAAGYGGGASVRVWENIYWGTLGTPESAMEWWAQSDIHFQGLTHKDYIDIGTGVAYSEHGGFFTLNFGIVSGSAPPPTSASSPSSPGGSAALPPAPTIPPLILATPDEYGSIIHTVGEGQTLWEIALSYDIPLSELLALNRLSENAVIRPGDTIIIVAGKNVQPPGPLYHTVQTGDTLLGIASIYGIDLARLLELNGLSEGAMIFPGDKLLIDPGQPTHTPPPPTDLAENLIPTQTPFSFPTAYRTATPGLAGTLEQENTGRKSKPLGIVLVGVAAAGVILMVIGLLPVFTGRREQDREKEE